MKRSADFAKRQHFVPEMHQKRFAGHDGQLWFFDRRRGNIDRTTPGNLFVEGHLYTLEDQDGARSGAIEQLLSRVESETEPVFERIVGRARQGQLPALAEEQRWALLMYMYLQYRRVPDFIRKVRHDRSIEEQLGDIVAEHEVEHGPLPPEARSAYLAPQLAKRLEQNFRALGVLGDFPNSRSFLGFNSRGLSVAVVEQPGLSFVLGSFPFVRSTADGRNDLGHPGVELWMPIAPDVAIGLAGPQTQSNLVLVGKGRTVADMNKHIRDKSTVIASPSRYLIEVLARGMTGPLTQTSPNRSKDGSSG